MHIFYLKALNKSNGVKFKSIDKGTLHVHMKYFGRMATMQLYVTLE